MKTVFKSLKPERIHPLLNDLLCGLGDAFKVVTNFQVSFAFCFPSVSCISPAYAQFSSQPRMYRELISAFLRLISRIFSNPQLLLWASKAAGLPCAFLHQPLLGDKDKRPSSLHTPSTTNPHSPFWMSTTHLAAKLLVFAASPVLVKSFFSPHRFFFLLFCVSLLMRICFKSTYFVFLPKGKNPKEQIWS